MPRFVRMVRFRDAPSLFQFRYSDRLLAVVAWAGVVLAASVIVGLPQAGPIWAPILVWLALWALYVSIVNVGQTFYSFGWESLLCEVGALAILLGDARTAPPILLVFLMRWLLFRLEFGAGLIKLRGDRCWRDLTCLHYHHETQPMPNPLSWFFHHLPGRAHKAEVVANHFAQLVVPFFLFAPQPVAGIAGGIIVLTQSWLILSGNFSWLNFLTIVLAIFAFSDAALGYVLPFDRPELVASPSWYEGLVIALTVLVAVLSYWPVRNMLSRRQLMNFSFNRLHFVGTYGAFGHITKERYEIIIEGTDNAGHVRDVEGVRVQREAGRPEAHATPGRAVPPAPRLAHVVRGDGPSRPVPVGRSSSSARLLEGDAATLKLLRTNPFPDEPPVARARPLVPLPVHEPRRAARDGRVVGADAGRDVAPAAGARLDGRTHDFGKGCFAKNSHMSSLASTIFVDSPSTAPRGVPLTSIGVPGQTCPAPVSFQSTTSASCLHGA